MKIGLITYQTGHRRTLALAWKLMQRGHHVELFGFPFVRRETVAFEWFRERPEQIFDCDWQRFCNDYGLGYNVIPSWDNSNEDKLTGCEVYITCIAKIIPKAWIDTRIILNAHPGLLPLVRGVDSWKWAIIKGLPVGVTLHKIDADIDAGVILARMRVPLLMEDTLTSYAARCYDTELDLLSNFEYHLWRVQHDFRGDDARYSSTLPLSHCQIPDLENKSLDLIFESLKRRIIYANAHPSVYPHPLDIFPRQPEDWWYDIFPDHNVSKSLKPV